MNIKKILTWAGVAFVLYFLFTAPVQAGGVVTGITDGLKGAAEAVITFMQNLIQ
ncbi:hypothetical protein LZ318_29355 [Saccharopolyspora indica]|uniref:hypothetical protein n=1 Tax=Saccharopolyspora TaxID=1835 RepID=UPI001476AECF|nr:MULTISPECIES: hypothetical protein [Saccharopolyspora]